MLPVCRLSSGYEAALKGIHVSSFAELCRVSLAEDSVSVALLGLEVWFSMRKTVPANVIRVMLKEEGVKRMLILLLFHPSLPELTPCSSLVLAGRDGGGHRIRAGRHPFSDGVHHAAPRSGGRGAAALQPGHQAQVSVGFVALRRVLTKAGPDSALCRLQAVRRGTARRNCKQYHHNKQGGCWLNAVIIIL